MKSIKTGLIIAAALVMALPALAQQRRVSPHETISSVVDGNRVTLVYGRPYSKNPRGGEDRKIWGSLVPYGRVWRLGSDESTMLITQQPIKMGDTTVPAGAYTLYMLPQESGASKLIINKQLGQWGTQYSEDQDFARVDMKKESVDAKVDQFTSAIDRNPSGGGVLKFTWENTQYSVPFTVVK